MKLGDVIKTYRSRNNVSLRQFEEKSGLSRSYISLLERDKVESPTYKSIEKTAAGMGITVDSLLSLLDDEQNISLEDADTVTPPAVRVNVYGKIPAGTPLEAIEDVIDWEEIPSDWCRGGKEYFALQVEGDSMYPVYLEGDIIICQVQPDFEDGQDCVVFINGYDATLKRCYHLPSGIRLLPINPSYPPRSYTAEEGASSDDPKVRILGVVREIRRKM